MTTPILYFYTLVGQRHKSYQTSLAARGSSLKQEIEEHFPGK